MRFHCLPVAFSWRLRSPYKSSSTLLLGMPRREVHYSVKFPVVCLLTMRRECTNEQYVNDAADQAMLDIQRNLVSSPNA